MQTPAGVAGELGLLGTEGDDPGEVGMYGEGRGPEGLRVGVAAGDVAAGDVAAGGRGVA